MIKECKHPTCGNTCRREKKSKGRRRYIKKVADKRQDLNKQYSSIARLYRRRNPYCKIFSPVCTRFTEGVHHRKGKVGNDNDGTPMLIAVRWWMPACNACNRYVEQHDEWAREQGHKLSKFN